MKFSTHLKMMKLFNLIANVDVMLVHCNLWFSGYYKREACLDCHSISGDQHRERTEFDSYLIICNNLLICS